MEDDGRLKVCVIGIDPGTVNCGVCVLETCGPKGKEGVRIMYVDTLNLVKNKKQSISEALSSLLPLLLLYTSAPYTVDIATERQMRGKMRCVYTAIEMWARSYRYIGNVPAMTRVGFGPYNAYDVKASFGIRCRGHGANKRNALLAAKALTGSGVVRNCTSPVRNDHEADALLTALHHLHVTYDLPKYDMKDIFLRYERVLEKSAHSALSKHSDSDSDTDKEDDGDDGGHPARNNHPRLRHKTKPVLPAATETPGPA